MGIQSRLNLLGLCPQWVALSSAFGQTPFFSDTWGLALLCSGLSWPRGRFPAPSIARLGPQAGADGPPASSWCPSLPSGDQATVPGVASGRQEPPPERRTRDRPPAFPRGAPAAQSRSGPLEEPPLQGLGTWSVFRTFWKGSPALRL